MMRGKILTMVRVAMTGDVKQADRVAFLTKVRCGQRHSTESQNNFLNFNLQSIKVLCLFYLLARISASGLELTTLRGFGRGTADKNTSYPRVLLARDVPKSPDSR